MRGALKRLRANQTNAEGTDTTTLTSFNTNGFSTGSDDVTNRNSSTYAAWAWDAGSSTVTNNDGSIASQVRANPSAGFSIVTYTGNNTAGASVGHGLNAAVEFLIVKSRDQSGQYWHVWHSSLANNEYIYLNVSNAKTSGNDFLNGTAPGSSVFTLGSGNACNKSGDSVVAYCFAPVEGYSAMGTYQGNGNADGVFVHTGFKIAWLMVKRTDAANDWVITDGVRNTSNVVDKGLYADLSSNESTATRFDFVSNGFKIRNTLGEINASGGTYVYLAFASNPFKTARAR